MKNQSTKINWPLVGNQQIVKFLEKIIENSRNNMPASGSYIFSGQKDLGKFQVAHYFAQSLLCEQRLSAGQKVPCQKCPPCRQITASHSPNRDKMTDESGQENINDSNRHADLRIISRDEEKKNISISQIREFIRDLSMSSFFNSYKVGIIKDVEYLSDEAANALLKTLEEPRNMVVIILLTSDLESLPKTIISRSQILRFHPVSADIIYDFLINEHKAPRSVAKNFSRLCLGRPALALKFWQNEAFRENYLNVIKIFSRFINADINERFELINGFLGKKSTGQLAVGEAINLLDLWQFLIRDLWLLNNNLNELTQHIILEQELNELKNRLRTNQLLDISRHLELSKRYIRANVNPKLALENFAVSI